MAYEYDKKFPSIGQHHKNSCWAASISWWLQVMAHGFYKRKWLWQEELIAKFKPLAEPDGSMSTRNVRQLCLDPDIRMKIDYVSAETILDNCSFEVPCLLIFNYPTIGGTHMNVVFNRDYSKDTVVCMEPYHPFPGTDGKRTGQFVTRPLEFFFNSEEIGYGYGAE